jgi:hypothetical protein
MAGSNLDDTLNKFVSVTTKSKVAVIVPLFGYWDDVVNKQLDLEVIKIAIDRVYSSVHQLYIIFVAEARRLPRPVSNYIMSRQKAGNVFGVPIDKRGATYVDYFKKGVDFALSETDAQFIININPWIMTQEHSIDIMIDRVNVDDAKMICGFDLKGVIDAKFFDTYRQNAPVEERDINLDFFGCRRLTAEMITVDENYKTHYFMARDMWQSLYSKGFEAITTQRVPIFSFNVRWDDLESVNDFNSDKQVFINKWKFAPNIEYIVSPPLEVVKEKEDEQGA